MEPCRKCSEPNPETNQYCRKCGAVLNVETALVKAQRSLIMPARRRIRWNWVATGTFAIVGLIAVFVGSVVLVAALAIELGAEELRDLTALARRFVGVTVALAAAFVLAFGVGGLSVAWLSKGRTIAEPMISSLLILALLALAGARISDDALAVSAVLAVPCMAAAGLGGWVGELTGGNRKGGR